MTSNYRAISFEYCGRVYGVPLIHIDRDLETLKSDNLIPQRSEIVYEGPSEEAAIESVKSMRKYRDLFRDLPEERWSKYTKEEGIIKGLVKMINSSA